MLEQYQTEILALVALLVVILIYIMIKKRSSKTDKSIDMDESSEELAQIEIEEEIIEDIVDESAQESVEKTVSEVKEKVVPKIEDEFEGKTEGSFGDVPKQRKADNVPTIKPTHQIKKRAVPPHDKITKDNFKEFAGQRILVAEDNLINQKVINGLLADSGIEITIADDGQEALDILEKDSNYLLVLMDAHMPRVDGFEATRQIRANSEYDRIIVVALSGDTASDDIKKMSEAGMSEHLEKPLRMEALYDILYAYTGSSSAIAEDDDGEFVNIYVTQELDGDQGLDVCGGDEDFYREILNEFVATYESSTQELGNLLRTGQLEAADRLLLDLVGLTANIGAKNLNDISQIIKASLNDTTEKSYLTLVDQYKTSLDNLIKDIKEYK